MGYLRTYECDLCGKRETEEKFGEGLFTWTEIRGIRRKESKEPVIMLCPDHTNKLTEFLDKLEEGTKNVICG